MLGGPARRIAPRKQLEHVLRVYVRYYNRGRPHRALDLQPPDPPAAVEGRGDPPSLLTSVTGATSSVGLSTSTNSLPLRETEFPHPTRSPLTERHCLQVFPCR